MPGPNDAAGIKLLTFDESDIPRVKELGISIPTGIHAFIGLQLLVVCIVVLIWRTRHTYLNINILGDYVVKWFIWRTRHTYLNINILGDYVVNVVNFRQDNTLKKSLKLSYGYWEPVKRITYNTMANRKLTNGHECANVGKWLTSWTSDKKLKEKFVVIKGLMRANKRITENTMPNIKMTNGHRGAYMVRLLSSWNSDNKFKKSF